MQVSVIIVSYNTKKYTAACIESLYKYVKDVLFEIIIVDNASKDGSVEMIRSRFPDVYLIENSDNLGFGKANNLGISKSSGKYVFLLNSDTYLISNAVKDFYTYMEEHERVACCGGNLTDESGEDQISFGNFPSLTEIIFQFGLKALNRRYYQRHLATAVKNYDSYEKTVDYVSGADMFIRKSVLNIVGGFDEDFFLYYEETELSFRFSKHGYTSVLLPWVSIVHLEGGSQSSVGDFNFKKISLFARSRTLFYKKRYGTLIAKIANLLLVCQFTALAVVNRELAYCRIAYIIVKS